MYFVKAAQKSKIEEFEDVPLTIMAVVWLVGERGKGRRVGYWDFMFVFSNKCFFLSEKMMFWGNLSS